MKYLPKTACPACGEILLARNLSSHLETPACHERTRNLAAHRSIIELGLLRTSAELTPGVTFRFVDPNGGLTGYYTYDWVLDLPAHLEETGALEGSEALLRVLHAMQRHKAWGRLQQSPPGAARSDLAFLIFFESLTIAARQRFYLARASRLAGVIQELQMRRLALQTGMKPTKKD